MSEVPMKGLKIAVMGAGAVGCFFGGMLARGGHQVTLIARPRHVAAIRAQGLLLDTLSFSERVRLDASDDPAAVREAQCVLLCVKSNDTVAAVQAMAPHLASDAVVLSLQNGVDNAERAQTVLTQTVVPAVVYVAVEMAGSGHVKHHGRGELLIGPCPHGEALAAEFGRAGVPVKISADVAVALWSKLVINCAYNALSAIALLPYGRLVHGPGIEAVMKDAVAEAVAVARASGVAVPDDIWSTVFGISRSMATQCSSTAQDLLCGRPSEVDYLNGHVVRLGERLNVATPVNRTLQAVVKTLEAKRDETI